MSSGSPLDDVISGVERALHLKRRDLGGLLGPIEAALAAYRIAVETELAREYCSAHSLPAPRGAVLSPVGAARELSRLVACLPELAVAPPREQVASPAASPGSVRQPPAMPGETRAEPSFAIAAVLPRLVGAASRGRLVVVGAFSGRVRTLPEPLDACTDFIDTVRDGVHAVGNLPQRIRQGRIVGVIICDQAIAHQHAEPVVNAARAAQVPVGFAGKGGNRGLSRALEAIEAQLPEAHSAGVNPRAGQRGEPSVRAPKSRP